MSTYWGYRCETCGVNSPCWWNHGQFQLRCIEKIGYLYNRAIAADKSGYIEVSYLNIHDRPYPLDFLKEHQGHLMCLVNEYGDTETLDVGEKQ